MSGSRIRTKVVEQQKPVVIRPPMTQTQRRKDAANSVRLQALQPHLAHPSAVTPADILRQQHTLGNRQLQRLLTKREVIQRELSKADKKVEQQVKDLVKDGKYDDALTLICKEYGFTGKNFEIKVVPPIDDAWATTSGDIKAGAKQTLEIGQDLFTKDLTFIVRTIGHEFQHLRQRSQDKPIENQKEREFLAWGWEALGEGGPAYTPEVAAEHAKTALDFFKDMPEDRQKLASNRENQEDLEKIVEKAQKTAGH